MTDEPPISGRRQVEVHVDGEWRPGRLRSCDHDGDLDWSCLVTWWPDEGHIRTDRFPSDLVR